MVLLHEAEVVEALVAVTPQERRHVVGPAGATVRKLLKEFPDVGVTVPPPEDQESRGVLLKGPRCQVSGAQAFVKACLEAAHATHRHAHNTRRHAHTPARP